MEDGYAIKILTPLAVPHLRPQRWDSQEHHANGKAKRYQNGPKNQSQVGETKTLPFFCTRNEDQRNEKSAYGSTNMSEIVDSWEQSKCQSNNSSN